MSDVRRFFRRLITFFQAAKAESDLNREINAHLRLLEDEFIARGMSTEEARFAAKRAFGGVEQAKEKQRDSRSFAWLTGWTMDLRLGARMLVKSPGLTAIAVVALAVAIGAGAAYLEFVNDFFRPRLSFSGGDRLVGLLNYDLVKGDVEPRSLYEFTSWKAQMTTVEEIGATRQVEQNMVTEDGRIEPVRGSEISASAFRVVPIVPLYGRPLLDNDEKPSAPPVVVIGEDLWRARLNGNPDVIGRAVRFGDTAYAIAGIMPAGFGFPMNSSLWMPLRLDTTVAKSGDGPPIRIFGRLAPGADLRSAQAELEAIAGRVNESPENGGLRNRPIVKPYVESLFTTANWKWQVRVLYSFNIFFLGLLGICAANVATLVFARTATRESEITVRTALGASRGRIVTQLVAEAVVLASLAAIAGLVAAGFVLRKIREIWVASQGIPMPFWWNEQLGIETIVYSALLVVLAALVIGGIPALKATGSRMNSRLKEAGATGSTMRFGKLWTGVIITQVAVTVVFLLALVGLEWNAYALNQEVVAVAFQRSEYLVGYVGLEEGAAAEREKTVFRELQRRLLDDSGVINAAYTVHLPGRGIEFWVEFPSTSSGQTLQAAAEARKPGDVLWVRSPRVGANYFQTFSQPLVAGRLFTQDDIESGRPVAIVDESFVQLVLGGRNAIGENVRHNSRNGKPGPWLQIVGVVKNMSLKPRKTTEDAMLYQPGSPGDNWAWRIVVHARAADALARLRTAATATDPQLRLSEVMTMDRLAETDAQTLSFFTSALAIVAAVALMLSTAGIYSLISFTLARRTREIGIRTALGAAPGLIVTAMLSRAFAQVGGGILLGAIPGVALISITDLSVGDGGWMPIAAAVGVAGFVVVVATISCIPPVRRALKVQPTEALRTT